MIKLKGFTVPQHTRNRSNVENPHPHPFPKEGGCTFMKGFTRLRLGYGGITLSIPVLALSLLLGLGLTTQAADLTLNVADISWTAADNSSIYDPFQTDLQYVIAYVDVYYNTNSDMIGTLSVKGIDETFRDLNQKTAIQRVRRIATYGANQLRYGLYDSPFRTDIAQGTQDDISDLAITTVAMPANMHGQLRVPVHVVVYSGQVVPPGTYRDMLRFTMDTRPSTFAATTAETYTDIAVHIDVPEALTFSPIGEGLDTHTSVRMNRADVTVNRTLRVQANTPYHITMGSENLGILKHRNHDALPMQYTLLLDGIKTSFGDNSFEKTWTFPATSLQGQVHRFEFQLHYDKRLLAGDYNESFFYDVAPEN